MITEIGFRYYYFCSLNILKMRRIVITLGLLTFVLNTALFSQKVRSKYLLVVSYDGFRWDYPEKTDTPIFDSIESNGGRVKYSEPCFPSKTFPNHYSMATGLHPDNHGLVLNSFYCPELNAEYRISNREAVRNGDFYGGEPIWVAAEKQGIKSATLFWVGSEAKINGYTPTYFNYYNQKLSNDARIDTLRQWLTLPDTKRPRFIMLYHHEPDKSGHNYGPDSDEIVNVVADMDRFTGQIMKTIKSLNLQDSINVVITSDHGMAQLSADKTVMIKDYVDNSFVKRVYGGNPVYYFTAADGKYVELYNQLKSVPHATAWKMDEIPDRLVLGKNDRIGDFVLVADSSWSIYRKKPKYSSGTHGYDPKNRDMSAVFYAIGPEIKNGSKSEWMKNVDLYPFMAYLLGIKVDKTDGKLEHLKPLLR